MGYRIVDFEHSAVVGQDLATIRQAAATASRVEQGCGRG